jgi:cysteine sulfinate desulfinase/cysteine desulfurase-like protein
MGLGEDSGPAVRFSLGHTTTEAEVARVAAVFPGVVERLRALAAA